MFCAHIRIIIKKCCLRLLRFFFFLSLLISLSFHEYNFSEYKNFFFQTMEGYIAGWSSPATDLYDFAEFIQLLLV